LARTSTNEGAPCRFAKFWFRLDEDRRIE